MVTLTMGRPGRLPQHLRALENEGIEIIREVAACFERPVLLYSIGKDSSVLLHLARKAFYPAPVRMPVLHIDTGWKFGEMIRFRDDIARKYGLNLIVHQNQDGLRDGINPFEHGPTYTHTMKTVALKQALNQHRFDAAIGGARRDEEKARAKERIFSFRDRNHQWDPKNQRPEFWNVFNTAIRDGESVRAFPLSNWTEVDVWEYIAAEKIPIVSLYLAKERPVVERDGQLFCVDDERMPLAPQETPKTQKVRFRTLGCYPLTAAVPSEAEDLQTVIQEMKESRTSERAGRVIDQERGASMEEKKVEGYF